MHAAVVAVEQAGAGQRPAAGTHCAQTATEARLGLQEADVFAGDAALDADAADDDQGIQWRSAVAAGVRGDLQAVAGPYLAAIQAQGVPAIEFASGKVVGHAQRFHRRGQGDQGEVVQQQEADGLRSSVLVGDSSIECIHFCLLTLGTCALGHFSYVFCRNVRIAPSIHSLEQGKCRAYID
ncbi:hypothetical protein D3C81_1474150 [compost metagenome]